MKNNINSMDLRYERINSRAIYRVAKKTTLNKKIYDDYQRGLWNDLNGRDY